MKGSSIHDRRVLEKRLIDKHLVSMSDKEINKFLHCIAQLCQHK